MAQSTHAIATVGTVQDAAPIPAQPVQRLAVDWQVLIPLIFAGIALLINTTVSAWASVKGKTWIRATHQQIKQNATTGAAAGSLREGKLDHMTLLVNSQYSQLLQELADVKHLLAAVSGRAEDKRQAQLAQERADAHAQLSAVAARDQP